MRACEGCYRYPCRCAEAEALQAESERAEFDEDVMDQHFERLARGQAPLPERTGMSEQADDWVARVERAVWKELNRRRWFAHHVDGDEIEALEVDLKAGIAAALAAALASARADLERLQDDFMEQG